MKNYLPNYDKSKKHFNHTSPNLYEKLKPNLKQAIQNAKALGTFNPENPASAKAEMYQLFEILGIEIP
ncbi:MAG: hypothetical protein AAF598_09040 [Bacteroidota bacterium]